MDKRTPTQIGPPALAALLAEAPLGAAVRPHGRPPDPRRAGAEIARKLGAWRP